MKQIRNIAIIAHVDHGKTTLVDRIIMQAKMFRDNQEMHECFLDNNDLERERGITIISKNISIDYQGVKINVIDTPGHSDFGGQVERVLNLADGVILLVDSAEGPMPQTRFVLDKALRLKLKPIVVVNKVDKPDARPKIVLNKVFDLFCDLNADDDQLDFPVLYASGRDGWVVNDLENEPRTSIMPLMDAVVKYIPAPPKIEGPIQMQITTLDYSDYVGRIGIGRVHRGTMALNRPMVIIKRNGTKKPVNIKQLFTFEGFARAEVASVPCGDLCAVVGIDGIDIGDTITDAEMPEAMPPISVDEPTLSMIFRVNDSPFYGREGKYVSSRHLRDRLLKEAERDVALRVSEGEGSGGETFNISGRGVLHLSILIETMRREGYEMAVAPPQVICKEIDGKINEPMELLSVDVPDEYAGKIIELAGQRQGAMVHMESRGNRQLVEFKIPTRGLIGFRSRALTLSAGEAIVAHRYTGYEPMLGAIPRRTAGSIVSAGQGKAMAFAIDALQQRGFFFIEPNDECYEGMILGENSKEGDLTVNVQRGKQLTNMRASGSDHNMKIAPARKLSLEQALEYIEADELVEITPQNMRLRKLYLTELERKRNRSAKAANAEKKS